MKFPFHETKFHFKKAKLCFNDMKFRPAGMKFRHATKFCFDSSPCLWNFADIRTINALKFFPLFCLKQGFTIWSSKFTKIHWFQQISSSFVLHSTVISPPRKIPGQLYMYMYPTLNPGLCQRTFLELPDCEFICKIQCITIDTACPTILISLGFSQFCLKILNPNQYKIGMGKIPILTSVLTFQIFSWYSYNSRTSRTVYNLFN